MRHLDAGPRSKGTLAPGTEAAGEVRRLRHKSAEAGTAGEEEGGQTPQWKATWLSLSLLLYLLQMLNRSKIDYQDIQN